MAAASTGDSVLSGLLLTEDGGPLPTPTPHRYRPGHRQAQEFSLPYRGQSCFPRGSPKGRELSRMDLSAVIQHPHVKHYMDTVTRAGPDQFRSRPGHPAQWRHINRGFLCLPGELLCSYPAGLATGHVLVAWPAPGTVLNLPFLLHSPICCLSVRGQAMLGMVRRYHIRP